MFERFKRGGCCLLASFLLMALFPIVAFSMTEVLGGDVSLLVFDNLPDSGSSTEKTDSFRQLANGFVVPEQQNLSGLFGVSEISVFADGERQFVDSLANGQVFAEDDGAYRVDETSLTTSIRAGRGFNRQTLAAQARAEQAKAQTGQSLALLLPSTSFRYSRGQEKSKPSVQIDEETGQLVASDTHSRTDISFTLSQPLFDLPSFLDWKRRQAVEEARDENYRISDGDAYVATVDAYLSLVSSRLQIDIMRDFEVQLSELLNYIEKRASAGASSVSDMARVRARRQETLSFRLEQESAHTTAGIEFIRLTNLVPKKVRLPAMEDVGGSYLPESLNIAVAHAMELNPEIAALQADLKAARIDRTAAKSRFLPKLSAEYTYNYALHAGGEPSSDGQRDERLMLVVNWSPFSGGADYNYHAEKTARHLELQYRLDDQRRRIIQALSSNYAALATTNERIESGYEELKSISTAAEAMSKRMLSGNQSLLDLLDVYDRVYQARLRLVNLHILEMNTVAQLIRLTSGTPWVDTEEVDPKVKSSPLKSWSDEPVQDGALIEGVEPKSIPGATALLSQKMQHRP